MWFEGEELATIVTTAMTTRTEDNAGDTDPDLIPEIPVTGPTEGEIEQMPMLIIGMVLTAPVKNIY